MSAHRPGAPHRRSRYRGGRVALALAAGAALALAPLLPGAGQPAPAEAARPLTVVSLTFDDGNANQLSVVPTLDALGMDATFYVPSGYIGAAGYMTLADLQGLAAGGHEIGGHTVSHPDLSEISPDEAARQICDDRVRLSEWGFTVRSFAYPFAVTTPAVSAQVDACGYNSGRLLGDIRTPFGCSGCPYAESIPPANPFETAAPAQVDSAWTLARLKAAVTNAEKTGGWLQLTFHNVCASGCDISITPTLFSQFVTWLDSREASRNTVVRTVGDTVGGAVRPLVDGPVTPPPGPSVNGVVNPGMEQLDPNGLPHCWMMGGYGTNTRTLGTVSPGRTGGVAGQVSVSGYADGDAKWVPQFDLGDCSPSVDPGATYSLRAWYTSSSVTQYAVYLRSAGGAWQYWTSSPWFAAAPAYAEAVWETPPIPAGYTAISFGLSVFSNGTLTTDDYAIYEAGSAPFTAAEAPPAPEDAPAVDGPIEVHQVTGDTAPAE